MRPKDEKKVEAIYEATLLLNEHLGFVGMTMAKIAKEAGIATGTLYIYFKNKEELINSLYLHLKKQKSKNILGQMDLNQPYKLLFKDLFKRIMDVSINNFTESAFLEQYHRSPFIDESVKAKGMEPFMPFFQIVEKAKSELIIKDLDNSYIYACINGMINEFVKAVKENQISWDEKSLDLAFEMLWDAIKN